MSSLREIDPIAYDVGWLAGFMFFPAAHADLIWLAGWRRGASFARNRSILWDDDLRGEITAVLRDRGMLSERD
jgi:hypothetical protein